MNSAAIRRSLPGTSPALFLFKTTLVLALFLAASPLTLCAEEPVAGEVPAFALIDASGKLTQKRDLMGKVWLANFIFTRCEGPCPRLTDAFSALQKKIPKDAMLVSFSVDPEFDAPPVLDYYAKEHGAEPGRWLFLTGSAKSMTHLMLTGFRLAFDAGDPEDPGETLIHSTKLVAVDSQGRIRRYFDGEDPEDVRKIPLFLKRLTLERDAPWAIRLPAVNAALNLISAAFLLLGFRFIRAKNVTAHRLCMGGAFIASVLFLISYLIYHAAAGSVGYTGEGWMRKLYFTILISHSVLAAVIVPLVISTFAFALREKIDRHRKLARWTLPLWLYVSITGVVIYGMLYGF